MSWELTVVLVISLAVVFGIVGLPALRARYEVQRLRREYSLTDEEVEAYLREFPEVCSAVASSMDSDTPSREIERIASESAIMAILRARQRRAGGDPADMARSAAIARAEGAQPGAVTREDLERRRPPSF